jgi:hypothetical protein
VTSPLPACPCGQPHAIFNPAVTTALTGMIDALGELVTVTTPQGSWRVPRVYVAAHGVAAGDLTALAQRYGFTKVSTEDT